MSLSTVRYLLCLFVLYIFFLFVLCVFACCSLFFSTDMFQVENIGTSTLIWKKDNRIIRCLDFLDLLKFFIFSKLNVLMIFYNYGLCVVFIKYEYE